MPRPEDIAWKFVIRPKEGKKWRCPYCHKEVSGSVTRVKGHFLKQPKEGIASCTKVPEHIRTLMELLLNHELHNKDDIAWKFVNRVEDNKWHCYYCSGEFFGDLTGVKGHLLGVPNGGISICTQVPDHVRKLMRSLLDEVAEEESREANSPLSMGALFSPGLENVMEQLNFNQQDVIGSNSDQQSQEERQFQQSSTMPLLVQSSHAMEPESRDTEVLDHIRKRNDLDEMAEEESRVVAEEQSREAHGQSSMEPKSGDMPTQDEVAEEEIRDANSQFFTELDRNLFSSEFPSAESLSSYAIEQMALQIRTVINTGVNSDQQSQPEHQFHQISTMPLLVQSNHVLVPPQHQNSPHQSETRNVLQNPAAPSSTALRDTDLRFRSSSQASNAAPQWLTDVSNFNQQDINGLNSGQQSQAERQFPQGSTMPSLAQNSHGESSTMALAEAELDLHDLPDQSQCYIQSQMQMIALQTPAGASSFQDDQLAVVDNLDCLHDCNQHSQLQTLMDIDPSIASQHASDSHIIEATTVDSQVPEAATNATGPSSSQDMNRGSPVMDLRSIYANDEEIRNLKRKVEELDDKEAGIEEQMEIESAASSVRKKPRILVDRWLKETERARNNFQIIVQANAETLPPKEQVEKLTTEGEELIGKTLPQPLLIEERDAKGVKLLERKLTGKGIHRNIELIWDHLKENHACKLGIYGMGGVGKTTIMMHIHNRLLEDATFDGVVFITVSQDFSIKKLQSDIWKDLKLDIMEVEDEKKRAAMLSKQLERKKNCVLILDDVWERLDLEEVGIPIRANGFKLVLTTRSYYVCCQMQCQEKIKIKPLSQKEAESLFWEELGSEVPLNSEIEATVKSIVKECAGLPIGVITMARSMRGVTDVFEWRDSLVKLEESSKGQTDMKKVLMNLKFSYDRLGNPDVQQCFLSCALYPEDKLIDKFELVEFFIDQGLIGGLNTRREQYDRGLTILNKLGNVCLLEDHRSKMKMHDLIRDMALHIMSATSIVKARKWLGSIPSEEFWTDALERVSLMGNKISEIPLNMSPNCPKLSTLLLNGSLLKHVVIPDSFFKQLCGLKVLNLSGCELTELPSSISNLVNLRALLLRGCRGLRRIPCLGKLTSLRKLDVVGCSKLEEVPKGLEMLVNLRYLDLRFLLTVELPERVPGDLLNLQYLKVEFLDVQDMTKLRALETFECSFEDVNDFNKCVRVIKQSNLCYYYNLYYYLDKADDDEEEESDITRTENPERKVEIWGWDHAIVSVEGECTGIFILIPQDVQKMTMLWCNGITNLSSIGPLDYLEELEVQGSENLGVHYGGEDEGVIDILAPALAPLLFPSLRVLSIYDCPKLKHLFGHVFKSDLQHLQEIRIERCEEMVGIIAAITSPPPHPLPFFRSLKVITISGCNKMKRVVESEWMPHFPNLRRISVDACEKMEEIIGGPPPNLPVEEISLEYLVVYNCDNMRKLFPHEWLLHLRNLQSINITKCKGMVELISGAGQRQEGSIMTPVNNTPSSFQPSSISLPKLERLNLNDLPQLKSICEVPISCDFMIILDVDQCPELKRIPLQLRLRDIEDFLHIRVEDEEQWKTLMWDHPDAQAILQPYLRKRTHNSPNAIELFVQRKDLLRLCEI
ncbi:uncharacterized protein LOC104451454 isoform X2 [Eucalyptus grandis]|uniref:uncharacterized protein LOC104451454 isoform X2 n=1 Tax=Eucalyptus grandis TaxID=71139 RepID=UPI00192EEC68|nr:uncharacterized protein LOC104451454 isoform X2 [Eucalyptus grandis]